MSSDARRSGIALCVLNLATAAFAATALLLLSMAFPSASFAQRAVPPVDQAAQQPDFLAFRTELLASLARRDREAVLAVVDEDIKNSFGGDDGRTQFAAVWRLDSKDSALWTTLTTVLSLGGSFSPDGSFVAPYVYSTWPDDIDAFENMAVVARSVRIRDKPGTTGAVVGSVSHVIVELGPLMDPHATWLPVRLPGGKAGYMDKRFLRSPIDYRAFFQKVDGRWQMTLLVSGD